MIVLVHSPLLGPRSWGRTPAELRGRGREVVVPNLRDALARTRHDFHRALAATAHAAIGEETEGPILLAVHSAAGELVPSLVEGSPAPVAAVVFVDASLPRPGRSWLDAAPAELAERVHRLVEPDGLLRPWHHWFPAGMLDDLVPEPSARAGLASDIPRVPLAYFREPAPVSDAWRDLPTGYLRLSPAYEDVAEAASRLGWPVVVHDGHHLSAITDPAGVVDGILAVLDRLSPNRVRPTGPWG